MMVKDKGRRRSDCTVLSRRDGAPVLAPAPPQSRRARRHRVSSTPPPSAPDTHYYPTDITW